MSKGKSSKVETWLHLADIHSPEYDKATRRCILEFLDDNKVDGIVLGGDQNDFACISHWNKNNHLVKTKGSLKHDLDVFEKEILTPIEKRLKKGCEKIWIEANHERFLTDLVEESPELFGMLDHTKYLRLKERGWKIVPMGGIYKLGKLNIIHGETLSGGATAAKKAVEIYGSNVLLAHFHAPQSYSKTSPVTARHKFMAWVAPIVGKVNPGWIKKRANAWMNGFTVIYVQRPSGLFNLYPVIVSDGGCCFAGKLYGHK